MALSPLQPPEERAIEIEPVLQPSKTYALDLGVGEIGGIIDGKTAIRQFIRKAVITARFRFLIYGPDYGCELEDLIGNNVPLELLNSEIPRVIREALIYDERINDVYNFDITRDGDKLHVSFSISTIDGVIDEEVKI